MTFLSLSRRSRRRLAVAALCALARFFGAARGRAETHPLHVRYTFQPDCFRPSLSAVCDKRKTGSRLDLGPQIAVWLEGADGHFVDTLMVSNLTATRGLGNRPGADTLPSGPKFPYGKRPMVLPVWAHARGKQYSTVVMQDGEDREFWLGFHEAVSSPDPYYCRPVTLAEVDVDAISCPTATFNSCKGKIATADPKSFYPPRNDLRMFTDRDCDEVGAKTGCATSARSYADIDDLDAVATPTPAYGSAPYTGIWTVPGTLADGEYVLAVEVSKEFDNNASHAHPAYTDPNLAEWGLKNNFGQPSVVFKVPFTLSRTAGDQKAVTQMTGYGDWNGQTGTLHAPDSTISDLPGSGQGRLLVVSQPSIRGEAPVQGRVHVMTDSPVVTVPPTIDGSVGPPDGGGPIAGEGDGGSSCDPLPAQVADLAVPPGGITSETAAISFTEPTGTSFTQIEGYEIRSWEGNLKTAEAFAQGIPAAPQQPQAAGQTRQLTLRDLKPQVRYTVGMRPTGDCVQGRISYVSFDTNIKKFAQLSGCFVATAAYGSSLASEVNVLRAMRDRARSHSALAAALIDIYERSSPPLADLLRQTEGGRALVRHSLTPLVNVMKPTP